MHYIIIWPAKGVIQGEFDVGWKLLGMRKTVATFYCHFAVPVLKRERR